MFESDIYTYEDGVEEGKAPKELISAIELINSLFSKAIERISIDRINEYYHITLELDPFYVSGEEIEEIAYQKIMKEFQLYIEQNSWTLFLQWLAQENKTSKG